MVQNDASELQKGYNKLSTFGSEKDRGRRHEYCQFVLPT